MTPVDWSSPLWGKPGHNVHISSEPGDRHDDSEAAAERGRE